MAEGETGDEHVEPDDPPKADPPKTDSGTDSSASDSADSLTAKIKAVVEEVLGERKASPGSSIPRRADIEEQAKQMVAEAQKRLADDEAHKAEHEKIAEVAKKVTETAPKKVRRLTRALWGEDA